MAIFSTSCYVALGVGAPGGVLTELTGGSYARQALSLVGSPSGATQALAAFGAATGPTMSVVVGQNAKQIHSGAIFDAATGGNQLCHWGWLPPWGTTAVTTAFPAVTLSVTLIGTVAASYNIFSGSITIGELLGAMNGQPLITTSNLSIINGVLTASAQPSGTVVSTLSTIAASTTYANDAAAAAGGVQVGQIYRNGNFLMVRLT